MKVARAVQRIIERSPQLYFVSPQGVWNYVVLSEEVAAAAQDIQDDNAAVVAAAQAAAAAAAAAGAAAEQHHFWQQEQDPVQDPYAWLLPPGLQPGEQPAPVQQAALVPEAFAVDAAAGAVDAAAGAVDGAGGTLEAATEALQGEAEEDPGLHNILDLLLDNYELVMSDVSYTAPAQPASSEDTTATSPKPATTAEAASLPLPVLLHAHAAMEPQYTMLANTAAAAAAGPHSPALMGASSSAAAGPVATFLGLATCQELMLFAGGGVGQLMELYNKQLVPLMGTPTASVRELLVQWLPAARHSIVSFGQAPSVQQAVMQLLSRMVHMLLFPAGGSSSGGGYMSLGGNVACEQVLCVVEGLMQSLEGLSVLCSSNSSLWMEPGIVASMVQLWCAQILQQPNLPASCFIHQLLLHLGA
jgi:hypothetical protein